MSDVIELAKELIAVRTEGDHEELLTTLLAPELERAGFAVRLIPLAPGRTNLIASYHGGGALTLSGHLDVVPAVGTWTHSPFTPVIAGGRLYGRGSSDMKGGVAAMVRAVCDHARTATRGFTLVLTSGEETGCLGAAQIAALLPPERMLIIGEATDNALRYGHKGCTWLDLAVAGISAHASRPDLGRNAIDELTAALSTAHEAFPSTDHDPLGSATLNVGTISGGSQPNLVPATATAQLDVRTVPGFPLESYLDALREALPHGELNSQFALPAVWTDPASSHSLVLADLVAEVTGHRAAPTGTPYFTDAAVMHGAGGSYILGPGDPAEPHTVDESCSVARIEQAHELYGRILEAWEAGRFSPPVAEGAAS